ncbi:MAG: sigma-70 family RNA polymerase sigma factor [Anaerolineae bacterium]|nr:sigma-70 family RNA polymerase sigma factor [Anaerolineae bacterium]HOV48183.1 sigma-70 family RNA polymerase sigma factor [Anaerolineae bacterium]HXK41270.1 sigma-70 family RNA polymerase sigma factor [Anaerolineae bacterium]
MELTDAASWDETALVYTAQRGNLDAFNELLLHYQTQAYNLAYHLLQDPAAADDATQEAFISAYRSLAQFRGGSFRAWLLRIVTNACYDALRHAKRRPSVSWEAFGDLEEEANPHLRDHAELPEEAVERDELRQLLEDALARLPEDQRTVLVLVDRLGLSYEEVAETLQIQLGTVKSRLARARGRMRDLLLEQRELLPYRYRLDNRV